MAEKHYKRRAVRATKHADNIILCLGQPWLVAYDYGFTQLFLQYGNISSLYSSSVKIACSECTICAGLSFLLDIYCSVCCFLYNYDLTSDCENKEPYLKLQEHSLLKFEISYSARRLWIVTSLHTHL